MELDKNINKSLDKTRTDKGVNILYAGTVKSDDRTKINTSMSVHVFVLFLFWSRSRSNWKIFEIGIESLLIDFRAIWRDKREVWNKTTDCSRRKTPGLVKDQRLICQRNSDLMPGVVQASRDTVSICQELFADKRWNCSSLMLAPKFLPDLVGGQWPVKQLISSCTDLKHQRWIASVDLGWYWFIGLIVSIPSWAWVNFSWPENWTPPDQTRHDPIRFMGRPSLHPTLRCLHTWTSTYFYAYSLMRWPPWIPLPLHTRANGVQRYSSIRILTCTMSDNR